MFDNIKADEIIIIIPTDILLHKVIVKMIFFDIF